MSAKNLPPPPTYSRLFRPWDSNRNSEQQPTAAHNQNIVKCESETVSESSVNMEQSSSLSGNESDHECASNISSGSCSHSSEDGLSLESANTSTATSDRPPQLPHSSISPLPAAAFSPSALFHAELPQRISPTAHVAPLPFMPPTSEFYYAAAAAAAARSMGSAPSAAAPSFGLDPYAMGLMEHEYARVMAEDAHLKALNSRKQRPKKFKCPSCEVAFSNNGQLKGHIRIHTGERPFKCDVETCGKTFTRNEELTRHKRIHTGLRPYPCTACGKKFGRRDHLKKHMKTHIPQERPLGPPIFVPVYPFLYGY